MADSPGPRAENTQTEQVGRECPGRAPPRADASPTTQTGKPGARPRARSKGPLPPSICSPCRAPRRAPSEREGRSFPTCSASSVPRPPRRLSQKVPLSLAAEGASPLLHKGRRCSVVTQVRKLGPREVQWAAQVHTASQWLNLKPRTSDFKPICSPDHIMAWTSNMLETVQDTYPTSRLIPATQRCREKQQELTPNCRKVMSPLLPAHAQWSLF